MSLNAKQQRFAQEYLVDLNATQAAIRAGYSKKAAEVTGHRLLSNAKVASAIAIAQKKRSSRTEITQDRVLEELARIGFSDLRRAFDAHGNLLRPEEWPDDMASAISSVEVVTKNLGDGEIERVHKIRTWDKNTALEKIAKHLNMQAGSNDARVILEVVKYGAKADQDPA